MRVPHPAVTGLLLLALSRTAAAAKFLNSFAVSLLVTLHCKTQL